jgi:hypothetical protein
MAMAKFKHYYVIESVYTETYDQNRKLVQSLRCFLGGTLDMYFCLFGIFVIVMTEITAMPLLLDCFT